MPSRIEPTVAHAAAQDAPIGRKPRRTGRFQRRTSVRRALVGTLALAIAGILLILNKDDDYVVNARFSSAGQLVKGGLVEVAGVKIGQISDIDVTDDGQAEVEMTITDRRFVPFRKGTRASIRAVGQATLTNRYVAISMAPDDAPALAHDAVLPQTDTRGIVDLDAILSSVDGKARRDLQALFKNSAAIYAGSGATLFNRALAKLNPALAQVNELSGELAADRTAIAQLIRTGATAAKAVASRSSALDASVRDTAVAFGAVAQNREQLANSLSNAPETLRRAGRTLDATASTVSALRPALRKVPPAQPQLRQALRRFPKTLQRFRPVAQQTAGLLPPARTALRKLPPLEAPATEGARALGGALKDATPILEGVRYYGADFLIGVLNGVLTIASGAYNAQSHYLRIEFVQSLQSLLGGALSEAIPGLTEKLGGLVPKVFNTAKNQNNRCPGGSAPPAPDGSNPWYPRAGLCDPTQSMSGLVNDPSALCTNHSTCDGDKRDLSPDLPARQPGDNAGAPTK